MLKQSKVYNPQITYNSYLILKKLAWLQSKPMTKTLDNIISQALTQVSLESLCAACKCKKSMCPNCPVRQL